MTQKTAASAAEQCVSAWAMMPIVKSSRHGWLAGLGKQGEKSQLEGLVTMMLRVKLSRPQEHQQISQKMELQSQSDGRAHRDRKLQKGPFPFKDVWH